MFDTRLSELTFVALDVETTGLDPLTERVVEVGAFRFDRGGARGSLEQLVNPAIPIPYEVSRLHGITDEMVAGKPHFGEVLPGVMQFLGNSVSMAHNARFDIGFFDVAFEQAGLIPPPGPIICTRDLAHRAFPGLSNYKLDTLLRYLRIQPAEHHRALADAAYSAEVFIHSVDRIDPSWNMTLAELLAVHGPPFGFRAPSARILEKIRESLRAGQPVHITYCARGGTVTNREITPLAVESHGRGTKVVAYCHLRRGNRTFRLDCITKVW